MANIKLLATLCPSFPHYAKYSADKRLVDIRFNSAQTDTFEMDKELAILKALNPKELPIFDVKGRQLRVVTVNENPEKNLDTGLRHLRGLLDLFKSDVRLALAAYNAGLGAVTRYGGVPPYRETQNYVQRIMTLVRR